MTWMHLNNFNAFSSLRRPDTHFRHVQGHHWAGALTGSINIIQKTIFTVYYDVEHQKTINTKLGKQNIWFSKVIKEFHQYFQKNRLEDKKKDRKYSWIAFLQLVDRYYKIVWLRSTSIFKEQTRVPLKLKIEKKCRQKRITTKQFFQISMITEIRS